MIDLMATLLLDQIAVQHHCTVSTVLYQFDSSSNNLSEVLDELVRASFYGVSFGTSQVQSLSCPLLLIGNISLVLYELHICNLQIVFCPLLLLTGQEPIETGRINKKTLGTYFKINVSYLSY